MSAPEASAARPELRPLRKLMAANRSEIAVRIFRAGTELGLRTVAVFAHEDRLGIHRYKADEAYQVGAGKGPVAAYLDIDSMVAVAVAHGVDAIHPGYGFLSENAAFARAVEAAGITWVGPRPDLLEMMGDKTAARALAKRIDVPVLPGTEEPVTDRDEAMKIARSIGFPLIIKAAFGGGGRGMRVVHQASDLGALLDEAQGEAERAFGNPAVFLEKYISRAKHIEVQVLGDKHGNVIHLYERDCSVQRRHQKVIEVAPSFGLPKAVITELCAAAARMARAVKYDNAGTIEFLYDLDRHEWFFIEMNPRIQVEHTVTEVVTGLDLVRAQILIAQGHALHSPEVGMPVQAEVPCHGYAIQCRITTEDPANRFIPDYGRIMAYRSPGGLGIRLDGGMGFSGAVITPFYDSMLVKLVSSARTYEAAMQRTHRALSEFRIRGVKTNIPFLENVIAHPLFRAGEATTALIDTSPELFAFKPRRDRATKLLGFLGNVIVNGNPHAKGFRPEKSFAIPVPPPVRLGEPAPGTRQLLLELGPKKFAAWTMQQKRLLVTDTTFRDAHQSLMATRVRSYDMLACAGALAQQAPGLFSLEMWGGATFDTAMRFLNEDPWERLRHLRARVPNICFQMLFRGANAVGYTNYPDHIVAGFVRHAAASGMDIFRIFDSLNYLPNLRVGMEAVQDTHAVCEAAICYTGDILDGRRDKFSLKYYVKLAQELERMGAHFLAIKDMAGLCRPYAAHKLVKTLREEVGLPIHFHTHDTSGIAAASVLRAADAGVHVADLALAAMSGSTSQPNLNSIVAALQHTPRDTGLDLDRLNAFSDYWEQVRAVYQPFDTAPRTGSAEVYLHEMPGGQYTNLREQAASMGVSHRWPEIARTYAEVNQLFGDIVKVTPSSKVVGDLALFLFSRGIRPADVVNLEPGATPFPESVIDMLMGGLGWPEGGWPVAMWRAVLGDARFKEARSRYRAATKRKAPKRAASGAAGSAALAKLREELAEKLKRPATEDDLFSHLMYPAVFAEFARHQREYGDVSVLPSSAFFYGLKPGEEISVEIEEGKVLIIRLISVGAVDKDGCRTVSYELNGIGREAVIPDRTAVTKSKARAKADLADPLQVPAPIPGLVVVMSASVGAKVAKGDKLFMMEAMKMQTTVYAATDGVVAEVHAGVGDAVEAKDLIVKLRA
ncbi:2-oxoglutarate carboxylase small subunit [Lacunisphaera limnophila]|uniref:Pyruvate carboxylase n=1 Tax=Lacunisphaera limnophila TaxID=1838286 RepID=A0A1D8AZ87_9BACT|nr:pyruvate carboxylase [Lacunisphaera limnophila]AOS46212.1 2-oxoglutarate carboxylase small subunit [Lacunisphaera limnophila]